MRVLDIIFAGFGLIISSPLLLLVALLVRLDSKGPILFKQKRIGINGKLFKICKFRTMAADAELNGPRVTNDTDNRVTKIGYFLRKYKIDELPQFFNILKGDMSFVGPRPEVWAYKDLFEGHYNDILQYTPGIFGPNQVAFRNESHFYPAHEDPESYYRRVLFSVKAENDIAYFKKATFLNNITWIIRGVIASIFSAKW